MAVLMRFFLGCFNSLLGTTRAYASEICRAEHRALALSVVSTSRGVGLVLGPAIGGFFAQVSLVTGLFILLNDAVPQHQRGAANGISMTAMSVFKSVGPASGGALFSWAQKRQNATFLPGDQVVFLGLNLVMFVGFLLTFNPFLAQPTKSPHTDGPMGR